MLTVENLQCVRGEKRLFSGVSFSVQEGQWLHVKGENGAGKTSLLRILAGLAQPAEGSIRWDGKPIGEDPHAYRRDLLYFGHQSALKEDLSGLENLQFAAAIDGHTLSDAPALVALHRMGLKGREDLPVRVLSAGQKRRVMLARMYARQAKLWILDEPFTALDVKAVDMLCEIIAAHLEGGGMALLTSHQAMPIQGARVLQL